MEAGRENPTCTPMDCIIISSPKPLLTEELRGKLPPLSIGEEKGLEALAIVKYVTPGNDKRWYASAFDGDDTFFGLCVSSAKTELGYFNLSTLKSIRGVFDSPVERDVDFQPKSLSELLPAHR